MSDHTISPAKTGRNGRRQAAVEIIDFRPSLKRHFKALNLEWLRAFFSVERADLAVLDHPEREIIARGGVVLFARSGGRIVGTCAIVPRGGKAFELIKMAVAPDHRGLGIGKLLCLAALTRAGELGAAELVARTSPKLEAANRLYRSLGFVPAGDDQSGDYRRPTIVLRYPLRRPRHAHPGIKPSI
ncbi:MAG: GNAT family N-acetyltransferase [Candidatus Edwardsbacteria bacterium]|jgi:GNAT superfamily N-acetyltransferase|nr:GNAT family N-acetyltransferase [Candidatus Edwardsbacteria bacterium]